MHVVLLLYSLLSPDLRGEERADGVQDTLPPNMVPWHMGIFLNGRSRKITLTLPPRLSSLKQVLKLPCERRVPCTRRREGLEMGKLGPRTLYKQTLLNSPFSPVTSPPLTTHSPNPSSCQFFTNLLLLCLKGIKASYSGHFFGSSFSCEAPRTCTNSMDFVCVAPVPLCLSV